MKVGKIPHKHEIELYKFFNECLFVEISIPAKQHFSIAYNGDAIEHEEHSTEQPSSVHNNPKNSIVGKFRFLSRIPMNIFAFVYFFVAALLMSTPFFVVFAILGIDKANDMMNSVMFHPMKLLFHDSDKETFDF